MKETSTNANFIHKLKKITKLTEKTPSPILTLLKIFFYFTQIQKTLQSLSEINIILPLQEITPSTGENSSSGEYFSESYTLGLITSDYRFETWSMVNEQYQRTTSIPGTGEAITTIAPIEKTTMMCMTEWRELIYFYELANVNPVKNFRYSSSSDRTNYIEHLIGTNFVLTLQDTYSQSDRRWSIYDYSQASGNISPEIEYKSSSIGADQELNSVISIPETQFLFCENRQNNLQVAMTFLYLQDYTNKAIIRNFEFPENGGSGNFLNFIKGLGYIVFTTYKMGFYIYDWTGESGLAPIKTNSYQSFLHNRIEIIPGRNLLIAGDQSRNNYFVIDVEKDFEYVNHQSYKQSSNYVKKITPSYDGEYFFIISDPMVATFKVKIFYNFFSSTQVATKNRV